MRLLFIRHGQSVNNYLWNMNGNDLGRSEDPELTEMGYKQADYVASFLEELQNRLTEEAKITHIYSSLMVRAIETGTRIAERLNMPLFGVDTICEVGGVHLINKVTGEEEGLSGKSRQYLEKRFPRLALPDSVNDRGWWNKPYETREEGLIRARGFMDFLQEKHGTISGTIVAISHGDFFFRLMNCILKMEKSEKVWFTMNNTGISSIEFGRDEFRVEYLNRTSHLPADYIT